MNEMMKMGGKGREGGRGWRILNVKKLLIHHRLVIRENKP
jgi:hypothetical protein